MIEIIEAARAFLATDTAIWVGTTAVTASAWFFGLFTKMGKKFAEKIGQHLGEPAGEWLIENLIPLLSRYKLRYLEHVYYSHREFDVKGFAEEGPWALELRNVFVELSLDPKSAAETNSNPLRKLPDELLEGRHEVWDYLQDSDQKLAIIGAPGCGKTTLLKNMSLAACPLTKSSAKAQAARQLPIFLALRNHAKAIGKRDDYTLSMAVRESLRHAAKKPPNNWFERKLGQGKCLVLLDGLDEVADRDLRMEVVRWVEDQMKLYGKNRFVITSRPHGYKSNPISGVNALEVRPFVPDQVRKFVQNWYLANEIKRHRGKVDAGVRQEAKSGAEGLLGRLNESRDLSDLAVNPLLLTMIATVHKYRGSLPGTRVELYGEICKVFLARRRQARGLDYDLRPDQKQAVLEPLAYRMMLEEKREIETSQAVALIRIPLEQVRPGTHGEEFLKEIDNTSGLFVERENGVYGFSHLTFQEYLAAVHTPHQKSPANLAAQVNNSWWHECIRLYVAQADATPMIRECLAGDTPSVDALVLAIQCLEEAKSLELNLRQEFERRIAQGAESDDPRDRKPVCEALLTLKLKKMVALDESKFLSSYITNSEYQFYLDTRRENGIFRQPDHWSDYRFPSGQAGESVAGVRPSDAVDFCSFLSERDTDSFQYRLPTLPEHQDGNEQLSDGDVGYWSVDDAFYKKLNARARARHRARTLVRARDRAKGLELAREVRPNIKWPQLAKFLTRYLRLVSLSTAGTLNNAHFRLTPQSAAARLVLESSERKAVRQRLQDSRDACLDLYIEMTVLEDRISGEIPALGGIRVIKEVIAD